MCFSSNHVQHVPCCSHSPARHDMELDDGVPIVHRYADNPFKLQCLKTRTKTQTAYIYDDDAAYPAHSHLGLQRSLICSRRNH